MKKIIILFLLILSIRIEAQIITVGGSASSSIEKRTLTFQPFAFNLASNSGQSTQGVAIPAEMAGWSIIDITWRSFDPVITADTDVTIRKFTVAGAGSNLSGTIIL